MPPGFTEFVRKAGFEKRMPAVVACGGRRNAFESFRKSHESGGLNTRAILLVDSEEPIVQTDPWEHVRLRPGDEWQLPRDASPDQIHFMVQTMEAWFHADKDAVERYFGQGFRVGSLRQQPDIDNIPKADLFAGMRMATRESRTKGEYSKGKHSFEILARIDPARVRAASPSHAGRLLDVLDRVCVR